jgi:hypothetical protein
MDYLPRSTGAAERLLTRARDFLAPKTSGPDTRKRRKFEGSESKSGHKQLFPILNRKNAAINRLSLFFFTIPI